MLLPEVGVVSKVGIIFTANSLKWYALYARMKMKLSRLNTLYRSPLEIKSI